MFAGWWALFGLFPVRKDHQPLFLLVSSVCMNWESQLILYAVRRLCTSYLCYGQYTVPEWPYTAAEQQTNLRCTGDLHPPPYFVVAIQAASSKPRIAFELQTWVPVLCVLAFLATCDGASYRKQDVVTRICHSFGCLSNHQSRVNFRQSLIHSISAVMCNP